ncbi:hypothetical protein MPH_09001 [Macrophomina phaseolina MS6]|uniref:Uncharacterized protein n=1 Tax=Macrophomina phaseolina (strain MS6) TaxID=1126212 RepID=K2SAC1_MACPH|nr:hypothetical protein MPH_09001 [Macrophomina phaseolina MS6]
MADDFQVMTPLRLVCTNVKSQESDPNSDFCQGQCDPKPIDENILFKSIDLTVYLVYSWALSKRVSHACADHGHYRHRTDRGCWKRKYQWRKALISVLSVGLMLKVLFPGKDWSSPVTLKLFNVLGLMGFSMPERSTSSEIPGLNVPCTTLAFRMTRAHHRISHSVTPGCSRLKGRIILAIAKLTIVLLSTPPRREPDSVGAELLNSTVFAPTEPGKS